MTFQRIRSGKCAYTHAYPATTPGERENNTVTSHVFETLTSGCDYIHHINNGMIEQSYSKEQFGMLKELLFSTIEKQTSEQIKELI